MKYDTSQVSIIIACKNEGGGIKRILQSVQKYADDIIVVDGHSHDGTKEIAKRMKARFFLDHKKGRGDAVKIGVQKAKGSTLVFFDADGSHDEKDIPIMVKLIEQKKADLVIASRRTGGSFDVEMSISGLARSIGSDLLAYLLNRHFHTKFTDILYSFRAVRKTKMRELHVQSDDFGIEQEVVISALKKKMRVVEIPSREKARGWGTSKLRTSEGLKFLLSLLWNMRE